MLKQQQQDQIRCKRSILISSSYVLQKKKKSQNMDPYLPRAHGKDWILKGESALKTRQAHIFRVTLGQTAHFQRTLLGAHGNATRLPTVESAPMFRRAIHTRPTHPLVDEWKRCELSLHHIFVCAGTHTNIHLWVYMPCPHARRVASITSDSV